MAEYPKGFRRQLELRHPVEMMQGRLGTPTDIEICVNIGLGKGLDEGTEGPPIWDVVEGYLLDKKSVAVEPNQAVKVIGV